MAYVNCAQCPAQAFPTGRFVYFGYLEEFKCLLRHRTYVPKEDVNGVKVRDICNS